MNMTANETFSTSDLALAITISLHFPIKFVDRSNDSRVEFAFYNSTELQQLVQQFWQDELRVEPKRFYQQLRIIKGRIYDK